MSDVSLAAMGIGTAPNDAALNRPAEPTTEQRDAAMMAELAQMMETGGESGNDGVAAVEAGSQYTESGIREVAPPDPSVTGGDQQQTSQQAEGGQPSSNDAAGQAGTTDETVDSVLGLPPTGFEDNGAQSATTPGGVSGQQEQPSTGAPAAPAIDMNALTAELGITADENYARAALRMAKDLENLSPVQIAQIQSVLNGQQMGYQAYQQPYAPQPQPMYPQQPVQQPVQPMAPVPNPQYQQPIPQVDWSQIPDELDPATAQALQPIAQAYQQQQAQLQAMQAEQQRINQERFAQEQRAIAGQMDTAGEQWFEAKQTAQLLSSEEKLKLEREAIDSGLIPLFYQQTGDPIRAVNETLDHLYNSKPQFREREIAKHAEAERLRAAQQQQRTNVSTGLSGGGSPARVNNPSTNGNGGPAMRGRLTPDQNQQAMVDFIHEQLNQ